MNASEQARALRGEAASAELLRADAFYTATFKEPLYALLGGWQRTYEVLYRTFAEHGVRPDSIRWEGGNQPADAQVVCNLSHVGVQLRFRLTDLEIWTSRRPIIGSAERWRPFIEGGVSALQNLDGGMAVALHTFTLGLHWRRDLTATEDEIARVATSSLPGFRIWSVSLVSSAPLIASRTSDRATKLTVELQASLLFPDVGASFSRIACEIDGSLPVDEACELAEDTIADARERAGIDVEI